LRSRCSAGALLEGAVEGGQELGAVVAAGDRPSKRAALDELLEHAAVAALGVDPPAEVEDRGERAAVLAGLEHRLDRGRADALDRAQAEPDHLVARSAPRAAA
jgi:hypothetical protein